MTAWSQDLGDRLPYELTAEQVAREQMERLHRKYGDNPHVLAAALEVELKEVVHDAIAYGIALGDEKMGEIAPAELLVAYAAGAAENKKGTS